MQEDTCTPMLVAALLTIAKMWEQPKRPLVNEWTKKTWYLPTYLSIKRDTLQPQKKKEKLSFATIRMNLGYARRDKSTGERQMPCDFALCGT